MNNRPGVTLMEVLVAIFVMGIGMLAMLVLFPLGVLRMSFAIQDERCVQSCKIANSMATFMNVRNDPWVLYDPNSPALVVTITNGGTGYTSNFSVTFTSASGSGATGTALVSSGQVVGVQITSNGTGYTNTATIAVASLNGGGGTGAQASVSLADSFTMPGGTNLLPADPHGPSYPVFVDPMGYYSLQGLGNQTWLTQSGNANTLPRRTTSFALSGTPPTPNNGLAMRWTCLLDDMPFAIDGTPQFDLAPNLGGTPPTAGSFTRDIRYCWAYLLKRPRTADRSVVDMSVVVFNNNRPILSSVIAEYLYQSGVDTVTFDPVGNSITIDVTASGNVVPPCRAGDWLLDASYVPNQAQNFGTMNGNFYRVVGVSQNSDTSYTFEVQQPLRNMTATMAASSIQKVIFLEGVAEVFEKGPGRLP